MGQRKAAGQQDRSAARVEFYFSPDSRYSYLAASRIPQLERETGCSVDWKPLHGRELRELRGRDPFDGPPVSGQYDWEYRRRDAEAWAAYYGIPFHELRSHDVDFRLLVRACWAARFQGACAAYAWRLASAVYGADVLPLDTDVCRGVARELGLDVAAFDADLSGEASERALQQTAAEAHRRGAFGVPTFFLGERMFWGNDRLPLLRHALTGRGA
jgi:2-hydroxychromene-2-carboxylate isomerase